MARSRPLVFALLAQRVLAGLNLPKVDGFGEILAVATPTDDALDACSTAEVVISVCVNELPTDAPDAEQASCFCCVSTQYIASDYLSCASYIAASAPAYSTEYSAMSIAQSFCRAEGNVCGGAPTPTPTPSRGGGGVSSPTTSPPAVKTTDAGETFGGPGGGPVTSAPASAAAGEEPPACSSFVDLIDSCSSKLPGFSTMDNSGIASCLCYNGKSFTTAFDGYAATCASWAKTGLTSDYSDLIAFTAFCKAFSPVATATGGGSVTTPTGKPAQFGGGGGGSTTPTATGATGKSSGVVVPAGGSGSSTSGVVGGGGGGAGGSTSTTATQPTAQTHNLAARQYGAGSGTWAWAAIAAAFVFSFFVLL